MLMSDPRAPRDLRQILRGGYCTRWHANADLAHVRETLAEHHARVAQILLALHPAPGLAMIDAALHHDAGEPEVGDLPGPFKAANPGLAAEHAAAEDRVLDRIGVRIRVTDADARWLRYADRLAAYAHVAQVHPALLCDGGWPEARQELVIAGTALMGAARALDVLRQIEGRV